MIIEQRTLEAKEVKQVTTDKFEVTKTPKIETTFFTACLATGASRALPANVVCVRFISWTAFIQSFERRRFTDGIACCVSWHKSNFNISCTFCSALCPLHLSRIVSVFTVS
jgi:hypothetical protein